MRTQAESLADGVLDAWRSTHGSSSSPLACSEDDFRECVRVAVTARNARVLADPELLDRAARAYFTAAGYGARFDSSEFTSTIAAGVRAVLRVLVTDPVAE
mgnify:CR=1 FL=1